MIRIDITRIAAAAAIGSTLALGAITGAVAQQIGPRVVGTGENASVVYDEPSQNIVGGALSRQVGSGESAETEVLAVAYANGGRLSRVERSGESAEVVFIEPASASLLAKTGATR